MPPLYLPHDEFTGSNCPDLDLAADYLELTSVYSPDGQCSSEYIVDALEISAEEEYADIHSELQSREVVAADAVGRMETRKRILGDTYPFHVDQSGAVISFSYPKPDRGQAAYLISLLLSNLNSLAPLFDSSGLHPSADDTHRMRRYFQYFATAAVAAEIQGRAWSFGFPRPDGTGFIHKLNEIWSVLKDGIVHIDASAPTAPKDDQVDVFAWRQQPDGLPGSLLIAAQVATGKNWKDKSIKHHVSRVFPSRWFSPPPVTDIVAYHVIPFARSDGDFRDDVRVLGNILHRLRVPRRVAEAAELNRVGILIEAFDRLDEAAQWLRCYLTRMRNA